MWSSIAKKASSESLEEGDRNSGASNTSETNFDDFERPETKKEEGILDHIYAALPFLAAVDSSPEQEVSKNEESVADTQTAPQEEHD